MIRSFLLGVILLFRFTKASQLEIQAFQPAVVPIRAATTLTLKTNGELNVTSNGSIQCRFKDISVPARIEDGFIFCDTPPMRNIDRVSVHLDVDGKLFKAKKPLYFHDPFKVSNITPSVVSPAQNVFLTVSGISCKEWMQYFVRFQTANGTKKTQQGICKDSIVSCFVPEFPPSTRLRVGLTLSNRLVQWADKKILIQYPVDAMKSSVEDVKKDNTKKGAFTFMVVLRDRFRNFIRVVEKGGEKHAKISVQYTPQDMSLSMRFLECSTTLRSNVVGDVYILSCTGAEKELIYFYPSINNVPLGGQDKYEARTTLCPGKNTCEAEPKAFPLVLVLGFSGAALLVLLLTVILLVRHRRRKYRVEQRRREAQKKKETELEMEVQLPGNDEAVNPAVVYDLDNAALDTSDEGRTNANPTPENTADHDAGDSSPPHLSVADSAEETAEGQKTDVQGNTATIDKQMLEKGDKKDAQSNKEFEMSSLKEEKGGISVFFARYKSSVDKLLNLVYDGTQEREIQNCEQLDLVKQMEDAFQEIRRRWKKQEEETAIQKMENTTTALRLAYEDSNNTGYCNLLSLMEELKENMAALEKVANKGGRVPVEENETAF